MRPGGAAAATAGRDRARPEAPRSRPAWPARLDRPPARDRRPARWPPPPRRRWCPRCRWRRSRGGAPRAARGAASSSPRRRPASVSVSCCSSPRASRGVRRRPGRPCPARADPAPISARRRRTSASAGAAASARVGLVGGAPRLVRLGGHRDHPVLGSRAGRPARWRCPRSPRPAWTISAVGGLEVGALGSDRREPARRASAARRRRGAASARGASASSGRSRSSSAASERSRRRASSTWTSSWRSRLTARPSGLAERRSEPTRPTASCDRGEGLGGGGLARRSRPGARWPPAPRRRAPPACRRRRGAARPRRRRRWRRTPPRRCRGGPGRAATARPTRTSVGDVAAADLVHLAGVVALLEPPRDPQPAAAGERVGQRERVARRRSTASSAPSRCVRWGARDRRRRARTARRGGPGARWTCPNSFSPRSTVRRGWKSTSTSRSAAEAADVEPLEPHRRPISAPPSACSP